MYTSRFLFSTMCVSLPLHCCRGPLPVCCPQLSVQVGLVSAAGLSQLLVLAAAAAQPYKAASVTGVGRSQTQQQYAPAPNSEQQQQRGLSTQQLPEKALAAMAMLPDKVRTEHWTAVGELSGCA